MNPSINSLKEIAVDFLQMVVAGKVKEAYQLYIEAGFRHHNPWFKGDALSLRVGMEENALQNPHKSLEIKRVIQDGDLVAVHSWIRQHPGDNGAAVVHIFRFHNNRIVELWDIGMALPSNLVNENGLF